MYHHIWLIEGFFGKNYIFTLETLKNINKESLLPFPAWGEGNVYLFFPSHFFLLYPVILNSCFEKRKNIY
jgi:hypothetical protein